jgi:hypothetical protein
MDPNLQNINEVFNRAYHSYEEDPSAAAWEKLSSSLDKEDTERYKRRFIGWKRIAVVLIFLLGGVMIYETSVVLKRKKDNEIVKKKGAADSAVTADTQGTFTEKVTTKTNVIRPERDKPSFVFENAAEFQPFEDFDKVAISPGIVVHDETEARIDKNLSANESLGTTKHKPFTENIQDETDSIREVLSSLISPITIIRRISPSVLAQVIKEPGLPIIKATLSIGMSKSKKVSPSWSVTAFASNDWGTYILDNDVQDNTSNQHDEKEEINHREKHERSISAGFFAMRQFSKHLGIKTGLMYSNTAIGISPHLLYAAKKPDGGIAFKYITSSGYGFVKPVFGQSPAVGDSILSTEAQHNLQMISIPLMVSYRIGKNKLRVLPAIGVSANFITNASVKTEVKDALNKETITINRLEGMKNFYLGLIADINLQYNYNDKWSFSLLPGIKYGLSPITQGNAVKTFPYSFNMGAGATYKF